MVNTPQGESYGFMVNVQERLLMVKEPKSILSCPWLMLTVKFVPLFHPHLVT